MLKLKIELITRFLCNRKNAKICTLAGMKELLYEVRCLKSNEDMILTFAGQFKQLSHETENSGDSTGFEPMTSAMPVQCSNQLSYESTSICWANVFT